MIHKNATENHRLESWVYADSTERGAATGLVPADVGRVAFQSDDGSYWRLTDDSPITWLQIMGAVGSEDWPTGLVTQTAFDDHLNDTEDAHDASAISADPTGLSHVAGTDVQTALEELDAAVTAASGTGGAPTDAHFLTTQAESGLSNEFSLGSLTTGMLKHTVSGSVSTPATAVEGTDYYKPGGTKVALADVANIANQRILGNDSGGSASPEELTGAEATALLSAFAGDSGSGGVKGLVPAPSTGDATKYLKGDGTWATVSGGGGGAFNGPLFPRSAMPKTSGKVYPSYYGTSGVESLGVIASLNADATWELNFVLPPSLPSGTMKLDLRLLVESAGTGDAKINPKWVAVGVGDNYASASPVAEGVQTVTWAALNADADIVKQLKVTLDADTASAGEMIKMNLVFETSGWTLNSFLSVIASIIWE